MCQSAWRKKTQRRHWVKVQAPRLCAGRRNRKDCSFRALEPKRWSQIQVAVRVHRVRLATSMCCAEWMLRGVLERSFVVLCSDKWKISKNKLKNIRKKTPDSLSLSLWIDVFLWSHSSLIFSTSTSSSELHPDFSTTTSSSPHCRLTLCMRTVMPTAHDLLTHARRVR